jgi:hypothetical protein
MTASGLQIKERYKRVKGIRTLTSYSQKKMMTKLQQKALNASNATDAGEGGVGAAAALLLRCPSVQDLPKTTMYSPQSALLERKILRIFFLLNV